MDSAASPERPSVPRQPDLFDGRGKDDAVPEPGRPPRPLPAAPATLADDALIAALPEAGPSEVGAICSEIAAPSLEGAVPALEALWRRFVGFGIERPLAEQLAVLEALAGLDRPAARAALRRTVLGGVAASALPAALGAAARAGLTLPAGFVVPHLDHAEAAVRGAAFALADRAKVAPDLLRAGLHDASRAIRRAAAIALAHRGDPSARETLLGELARSPSEALVDALAGIADEDTVVHLGRCAVDCPALASAVIDALRDMESPRAARLARRLEKGSDGA